VAGDALSGAAKTQGVSRTGFWYFSCFLSNHIKRFEPFFRGFERIIYGRSKLNGELPGKFF